MRFVSSESPFTVGATNANYVNLLVHLDGDVKPLVLNMSRLELRQLWEAVGAELQGAEHDEVRA